MTIIVTLLLGSFIFTGTIIPANSVVDAVGRNSEVVTDHITCVGDSPRECSVVLFGFPSSRDRVFIGEVVNVPNRAIAIRGNVTCVASRGNGAIRASRSFIAGRGPRNGCNPCCVPGRNRGVAMGNARYVTRGKVAINSLRFLSGCYGGSRDKGCAISRGYCFYVKSGEGGSRSSEF